jgi:hypothetical protein
VNARRMVFKSIAQRRLIRASSGALELGEYNGKHCREGAFQFVVNVLVEGPSVSAIDRRTISRRANLPN